MLALICAVPGALGKRGLRAAAPAAPRALAGHADCAGSWSACTAACETAADRTFDLVTPQRGDGAACPTQAADCAPGDGACAPAAAAAAAPKLRELGEIAVGNDEEEHSEPMTGMGYFVIVFVCIAGAVTLWAFIFPHADHPGICGLFAVIDKDGDGDLSCLEIIRFTYDVIMGYALRCFCSWWNKKMDKERAAAHATGPPGKQPIEMMPSPTSAAAVAAEG